MINRKKTTPVKISNIYIGGDNKIAVQSMCNTKTADILSTVNQITKLKNAGCDIIRVAVPDEESARAIYELKNKCDIPIVADIHFSHKLALMSIDAGADKIRINPGNIGSNDRVSQVISACIQKNIPVRIGVNSGSLEKDILQKYGAPNAQALSESVIQSVRLLESMDFNNIVLSVKSSDVRSTVDSYKILSEQINYPLHIGVTEAGTLKSGIVKSAAGIGALLLDGIGDTFRVSLTADPIEEITAAYDILTAVGLNKTKPEIISCPTCGRTQIDLITLANKIEEELKNVNKCIKVAVMGCAVNGPGEAREADIGVAGGKDEGLIFKKGKILRKVPENEIIPALLKEINDL